MLSPAELIVRTADLAEAEGRELRRMTVRVGVACGFILAATLTTVGGVGFVLAAVYLQTAARFGSAAGAGLTGLAALLLGGLLGWLGCRIGK